MQHITYTEYLPLILGDSIVAEIVKAEQYNNSLDASVSNAFATAAFRFGHSMIPEGDMSRLYGIRAPYNRFFPCMEATYPYAIKNQGKVRNAVLYGIGELV